MLKVIKIKECKGCPFTGHIEMEPDADDYWYTCEHPDYIGDNHNRSDERLFINCPLKIESVTIMLKENGKSE